VVAAVICGSGGGGPMRTGEMLTSQYMAGWRVGTGNIADIPI